MFRAGIIDSFNLIIRYRERLIISECFSRAYTLHVYGVHAPKNFNALKSFIRTILELSIPKYHLMEN